MGFNFYSILVWFILLHNIVISSDLLFLPVTSIIYLHSFCCWYITPSFTCFLFRYLFIYSFLIMVIFLCKLVDLFPPVFILIFYAINFLIFSNLFLFFYLLFRPSYHYFFCIYLFHFFMFKFNIFQLDRVHIFSYLFMQTGFSSFFYYHFDAAFLSFSFLLFYDNFW